MNPLSDKLLVDALTDTFSLVVPEIVLVTVACGLFLFGLFARNRFLHWLLAVSGVVLAMIMAGVYGAAESELGESALKSGTAVYYPILPTAVSSFVRWLTLGVGLLLVLLGTKEATKEIAADYYACVLVVLAGTSLVGRANDLVTLYLALELISIPTYVLLYLPATGKAGQEAAAKYFLLSVLSSGITLFGFSYYFGLAGSTNLTAIGATLTAGTSAGVSPLAVLAAVFVIAGLAFRMTAVPFQFYAPDVYQGGPTAVVAQLAVLPKVAGFIAVAKLLGMTRLPITDLPFPAATQIPFVLWVLAAATMTVGNVLALRQDNLRRLLAYSGVAHGGYMLLGLVTVCSYAPLKAGLVPQTMNGLDSVLFYLIGYTFMTLGVFAVLAHLQTADRPVETVDDLAGVGQSNPVAGAVLFISLLSLIGIPLTAGFNGKLFVFLGLYDAPMSLGMTFGNKLLVVLAAVNAAIGAVYYLKILNAVYLRSPLRPTDRPRSLGPIAAALVCAMGTIVVGVYPQPFLDLAKAAAPTGLTVTK